MHFGSQNLAGRDSSGNIYNKPGISRIQVDRQIYPSYAKIRLMRSEIEIKGFGTIESEILSEICEDSTDAKFNVQIIRATNSDPFQDHATTQYS